MNLLLIAVSNDTPELVEVEKILLVVESIFANSTADISVEVIIVDNASSDGAREYLPNECPQFGRYCGKHW